MTRGKREEYIETEKEMNALLMDLGTEGVKFTKLQGGRKFNSAQLKEAMTLLVELGKVIEKLAKKGIEFKDYTARFDAKRGIFPRYVVKEDKNNRFVYDDTDLAAQSGNDEETQYTEIFESEELERIEGELVKLGLDIREFEKEEEVKAETIIAKDKEKRRVTTLAPRFQVEDDKDLKEFYSLREVLNDIQENARKGMHIQRYKGLGEMNPQQLWDTTMDPQRRTLLQVALEDAVEADKTFTMLMGDC